MTYIWLESIGSQLLQRKLEATSGSVEAHLNGDWGFGRC